MGRGMDVLFSYPIDRTSRKTTREITKEQRVLLLSFRPSTKAQTESQINPGKERLETSDRKDHTLDTPVSLEVVPIGVGKSG
jgi:hypothetical protein